jgi:hypothetical protein
MAEIVASGRPVSGPAPTPATGTESAAALTSGPLQPRCDRTLWPAPLRSPSFADTLPVRSPKWFSYAACAGLRVLALPWSVRNWWRNCGGV